jgi:hypothetical protein
VLLRLDVLHLARDESPDHQHRRAGDHADPSRDQAAERDADNDPADLSQGAAGLRETVALQQVLAAGDVGLGG